MSWFSLRLGFIDFLTKEFGICKFVLVTIILLQIALKI